jgi:hypothetical protein
LHLLLIFLAAIRVQASTGNIVDTGADIILGGVAVSGNATFNGLLDDLRIYNRALSATEVKQRASGAVKPSTPPPKRSIGRAPASARVN